MLHKHTTQTRVEGVGASFMNIPSMRPLGECTWKSYVYLSSLYVLLGLRRAE
jgi:hypothetical protein